MQVNSHSNKVNPTLQFHTATRRTLFHNKNISKNMIKRSLFQSLKNTFRLWYLLINNRYKIDLLINKEYAGKRSFYKVRC